MANPARGLLNREKRTKEKVWQHTPVTPAGTSIDVQNEWEENTHTHNDIIVLHPLGIFIFVFYYFSEKNPVAGIELTSQRVRGLRGTSELPGGPCRDVIVCICHRPLFFMYVIQYDPSFTAECGPTG